MGLMFRRKIKGGFLMVFERERKVSIWTAGMLLPIDIAWIGSGGKILAAKENAKPWRFLASHRARSVLELKAGTLKKTGTKKGDFLEFRGPKNLFFPARKGMKRCRRIARKEGIGGCKPLLVAIEAGF
jgi:uncharacterized membrane protein (UPF0127 family)